MSNWNMQSADTLIEARWIVPIEPAGVVLGVVASVIGADRSRLIHRPIAEGLLACELAVVEAKPDAAHGHEQLRIPHLATES